MNNETAGKKIGGRILDVITVGLLFAAFSMVYYAGFVTEAEELTLGWISVISFVGLTVLFAVGTCSCMASKVKTNSLTVGFLAFSAFQLCALIANYVLIGVLLLGIANVKDMPIRAAYIIQVVIILLGYVVDAFSFTEYNYDLDSGYDEDDNDEDGNEEDCEDEYECADDEEIEEDDAEEADEAEKE